MATIFEEESTQPSLRSIEIIEVEQLFGEFNYRLETEKSPENLLLLYGDNGSGKTTILECVFHLLSPSNRSGHRTYIAKTSFKRLAITFNDGWVIVAERENGITGGFSIFTAQPGESLQHAVSYEYEAENKKATVGGGQKDDLYIKFLRKLNLEVYFLRANREFENDGLSQNRRADKHSWAEASAHAWVGAELEEKRDESYELKQAIAKANEYIRRLSSRGVNEGGASANSLYQDVLKTIVGSNSKLYESDVNEEKQRIELRLHGLAIRSQDFARFRLSVPFVADGFLATLKEAEASALPLISSVLEPYLDSVTARLDALENTKRLVSSLVEDVNSFFTNKYIRFTLNTGVQIFNSRGETLSPEVLSSGEKHLLLMFCHTVVAHGKRTIFIIDEPELSLNIKWQGRLVGRLLDLVVDSPMQFIFATHSIELLSQRLDHTARLISGAEKL